MGYEKLKIYSYYLPQFHSVPVNDKWWGEGYTEWTAVRNAKPLYVGHYQPHEPMNDNYYNLLDKKTMIWQSELMHQYGIDGMCFYHYWFSSDEVVLEKPAENLLNWKDIDMPFCFSWANESWLNKWSNREGFPWINDDNKKKSELKFIYRQKYGRLDEWEKHFNYLLPFFRDDRYIKIDEKPLFVFHSIDNVPCLHEMLSCWRMLARSNGFDDLYLIGIGDFYRENGIDAIMTHEPGSIRRLLHEYRKDNQPMKYSYDETYENILSQKFIREKKVIYTGFCDYDTTPRYGKAGIIYENATPQKFAGYLTRLLAMNFSAGNDMIFLDAWNEWAEGMHLEPDKVNGYEWLKAILYAKKNYSKYIHSPIDDQFMSREEYLFRCANSKGSLYVDILHKWMELKEHGMNIMGYLEKNGIRRILIYGLGILAEHLIWECKAEGINIVGIIDRDSSKMMDGIELYKMDDCLPEADAIVVAAVYYIESICKEIRNHNQDIMIYSLEELLLFAEERYEE